MLSSSCGSDAGSRGRGRKFPVAVRKIPNLLDDVGDGAESGGVTPGSSRRGELASVKVGHKPQEGWCPWFATLGNTMPSAIETPQHPLGGLASFTAGWITEFPLAGDPGEVQGRRARQHVLVAGGEKALKREPGRVLPCLDRKVSASERGPGSTPGTQVG
jgi:hypothetical protein